VAGLAAGGHCPKFDSMTKLPHGVKVVVEVVVRQKLRPQHLARLMQVA
jgi:hypothetical protein